MSSTFDEAAGATLLARFKRELKSDQVELSQQAETELVLQLGEMLKSSKDAQQLVAQLYERMPFYVGLLVSRGLARRERFTMADDATITVELQDLRLAFAKCELCQGLGTPP